MQRIVGLVVVLILTRGSVLWADDVVLTNGDQLSGTITHLIDGKLTIASELAGDVTVEITHVQTFTTTAPIVIQLTDGRTIRQRVQAGAEAGQMVLDDGQLLVLDDVEALNPPTDKAKWAGNVQGGLTLTQGNTETESLNFGLNLERQTMRHRSHLEGSSLYGRQKGEDLGERQTTQAEWLLSLKHDFFISKRFYIYGAARFEQDFIADLTLRLLLGAGGGYQWVDRQDFHLSTEGGSSWQRELFEDGETNDSATLRLAYHLDKHFAKRFTFFHDLEVFPNVTDFTDIFLTAKAGLNIAITKALFAEAKVVVDHDSTPADEAEETDVTSIFSVGVKF